MASAVVSRLSVLFGLDPKEFERGIKKVERELDNVTGKMKTVSAVGAAAFTALGASALNYADQLVDVADANEVALEKVVKMSNALQDSGGSANDAGKVFSAFSLTVDKAANGSEELIGKFNSLGVSLKDIQTLSIDQLFDKAASSLGKITDPIERNAKAVELFGKGVRGLDIQKFANELSNGAGVAGKQANAMRDAADAVGNLEASYRNLLVAFNQAFAPIIKDTTEWIRKFSEDGSFTRNVKAFGAALLATFGSVALISAIRALQLALSTGPLGIILGLASLAIPTFTFLFKRQDTEASGSSIADIQAELDNARKLAQSSNVSIARDAQKRIPEIEALLQRRLREGRGSGQEFVGDIGEANELPSRRDRFPNAKDAAKAARDFQAEIDNINKLYAANENVLASFNEQNRARRENLDLRVQSIGRSEQENEIAQAVIEAKRREDEAISQLNITSANYLETVKQIRENSAAELENTKEQINAYYEKVNALDRVNQALDTPIDKFGEVERALYQHVLSPTQLVQEQTNSLFYNMTNALDNFVQTGKFKFKDFAASVIRDLISIQLRAQATSILSSILGNVGTSFRYGTNIGSQQTSILAAQDSFFNLPGRANGGPVNSRSPYLVGERGPELFVPYSSGSVVPNNKLGGGQVINQYNITGYTDQQLVKKLRDTIASSPKEVYGASKQGEREVGVSSFR